MSFLLSVLAFSLFMWVMCILGESIETRFWSKLGFPPDPKARQPISGNIFVLVGWGIVSVLVLLLLLLIFTAMAEGQELPKHDTDPHTAQHYPMLTNPLFPESEAVRLEREWMIGPCACGCGQVQADCCCHGPHVPAIHTLAGAPALLNADGCSLYVGDKLRE